jgi:outer membrane protein OmpU
MKKILLSTAIIVATAGVAAAEVTLSGSGRFGIVNNDSTPAGVSETVISSRLRFNVDAKLESDNGVTYGGRIRFQNSTGQTTAPFSPAMLYVESNGLRVEVGNSNTAYDSVALMYNPELGYRGTSFGDPQGAYYGFNSGPYSAFDPLNPGVAGNENRVGIYVAYSINGLNLKASFIQSDQTSNEGLLFGDEDESSIAVDYTFGQVTLAAAAANDAAGIAGNDLVFVGAAYAFSDLGTVGINYNDNGFLAATTTLYGNYKFGATTVGAYVTDPDIAGADTAYGIGASYDLGGATLAGSIQSGFGGEVISDLGVSMNF